MLISYQHDPPVLNLSVVCVIEKRYFGCPFSRTLPSSPSFLSGRTLRCQSAGTRADAWLQQQFPLDAGIYRYGSLHCGAATDAAIIVLYGAIYQVDGWFLMTSEVLISYL